MSTFCKLDKQATKNISKFFKSYDLICSKVFF